MGIPFHSIEAIDGFNEFAFVDRALLGLNLAIPNGSGSAGVTVSVAVAIPASANLPSNYAVFIEPSVNLMNYWISGKSATGFTLNIAPNPSSGSVAAGSTNVLIVA